MVLLEKEYMLSPSVCDEISEEIAEYCVKQHADRKDVLRYRLSAEELLLNWMDMGCEGRNIWLKAGSSLFSPYVIIEMDGDPVNPEVRQEELGAYCNTILISLNQKPTYSYSNGRNSLFYQIKKKSLSQFQILCILAALSILVGISGNLFLHDETRRIILDTVFNPLYDTFYDILGCVAGPMIFLSVAWGIYGIGDVETLGSIGKTMISGFLKIVVMYFASVYNVQCTPLWLLFAVFICIVVSVAAPPIPGGGAAVYSILFLQLGIPAEALAVALTLDIITDFPITAFDQFNLQMALINISSKMNRIDKDKLRN